ncbi:Rho termination factor N-terminal domain-containing protein [Geobacter pelophilus]|jgi:hypothetical protein|uniref:Rho termination factor N-terminal domain-containing protein n=1 Tax=Geoanaerobacter pelophilus TaxID=60036 RepID=A0AAW4L3F4_9BACT|nr:Rho termination factor N-terminal domain-containing protein [Geoanaerobacter pelophilus]MBT0665249.1 Rho termination factor N-terminal domain-containing protein [Geoanaerobacter pelophilus]
MKMDDVKEVAKGLGIKPGKMKKSDLIREIQRAEGNEECYNSGKADQCGQAGCAWREDC